MGEKGPALKKEEVRWRVVGRERADGVGWFFQKREEVTATSTKGEAAVYCFRKRFHVGLVWAVSVELATVRQKDKQATAWQRGKEV